VEKIDAVYIDPDISSLFGAVGLAAGGLKVVILEGKPPCRSVTDADSGEEIAPAAEPFLWRGLRTGAFLEALLNRLRLLIRAREKVRRTEPPLQVVTPDVRLDCFGDDRLFRRELTREFEENGLGTALAMSRHMTELAERVYELAGMPSFPPMHAGFADRLFRREPDCYGELREICDESFLRFARRSGLEEEVATFAGALIAAMGLPVGDDLPTASASLILDGVRRGIFRADETALRNMLLLTFKRKGGYVMPLEELQGVELGKGGVTGLRMTKSNYIYSRLYVGADSQLARYLPPGFEPAFVPTVNHTLTILTRRSVLPVGMHDRVAVVNRRGEPLYPEHVVRISIVPPSDKRRDDYVFLSAASTRPGKINSIENELWDVVRRLAPFIDEQLLGYRYDREDSTVRDWLRKRFFELPAMDEVPNLLPREGDMLAEMGMGQGVISGRILARVILKKLGLRAEI